MVIEGDSVPHIVALVATAAYYALVVWALVVTLRSKSATVYEKVVLTIILIVFPVIGLAAWALSWFTKRRSVTSH